MQESLGLDDVGGFIPAEKHSIGVDEPRHQDFEPDRDDQYSTADEEFTANSGRTVETAVSPARVTHWWRRLLEAHRTVNEPHCPHDALRCLVLTRPRGQGIP